MQKSVSFTKRNKRKILLISFFILFTIGFGLFIKFNINPVIKKVSEEQVRALTTIAVNTAASNVMGEKIDYVDLVQITLNENGDIVLIQTNSATINDIARKTVLAAQTNISSIGEQGIEIPLGSMSGLTFLTGRGPKVNIKVFPVGSVTSEFYSQFQEAGINQTKHKIIMKVISNVSVVMPGLNPTVQTVTEVILCENIIVGKVPEFYLNSPSLNHMLDLVP